MEEKNTKQTMEPEAVLWHVEQDAMRTQYHITIKAPDGKIDFILNYWPGEKKMIAEPFVHHEYSYTVHDFCDHENDDCVLDDPTSEESIALDLEEKYQYKVNN